MGNTLKYWAGAASGAPTVTEPAVDVGLVLKLKYRSYWGTLNFESPEYEYILQKPYNQRPYTKTSQQSSLIKFDTMKYASRIILVKVKY